MVSQPVVFELVCVLVESEHHPPGTATQARADLAEFGFPGIEAAEGGRDGLALRGAGLAAATQVVEVVFVEDHRAGAQQVLALQVVVDVGWQVLVTQRLAQALLHHRQRLHRTAVVVLPV